MNQRWGDGAAVCFKGPEKSRDHFSEESVFHAVDFVAFAVHGLLDLHHLVHCLAEPGFPGRLPLVVVWSVAQVGRDVESELACWGFASGGILELNYQGDHGVDTGDLFFEVMEGAQVKPSIGVGCIIAPCKGLGDARRDVLVDE